MHDPQIFNLIPSIEFEKVWVGKYWQLPEKEVHQENQEEKNVDQNLNVKSIVENGGKVTLTENNDTFIELPKIINEHQEQKECPVCGGIEWSEIWGECVNCMKPKEIKQYNQESEIDEYRIDVLLMKQFDAFKRDKNGKLNPPRKEGYWKSQRDGYRKLTNEQFIQYEKELGWKN